MGKNRFVRSATHEAMIGNDFSRPIKALGEAAEIFKKEIKIPPLLVGGFLSYNSAKEIVNSGLAD